MRPPILYRLSLFIPSRHGSAPRPASPRPFPAARLFLFVCLFALLHGCRSQGRAQITLRFWNGFTGPDGRTMLRMVKRFNEANPDVNVLMQRMDWNTYYKKVFVAGIGQRGPDVFVLHTNAMLRFANARFVRPIDDLAAGANRFPVEDIDANVWQADNIRGQHYGVPLDVHAMGMYYNRALFREAGIVDAQGQPRPPQNRAEFLDALRRLTRPAGATKSKEAQWGFVFTNMESNVYALMCQFGGKFFTPDNSRCLLDSPENVAALQFCVDLIRREKTVPPPEDFDAWVGFRQGKVGMAFEGIYMLADLQKQHDLDYGGAPVPQVGTVKAVWTGSHNLCLREGMDGPQTEAAWRFVRFLSDNSLDWADGGQIPARKSLRDTPRFRAMPVQSAFAGQIPYVVYMPQVPFVFEFNDEFDYAIEKALRGTMTPQTALSEATRKINIVIARQREDARAAQQAEEAQKP